jgi:parvulin-like peptidyl-prolyl isomerase
MNKTLLIILGLAVAIGVAFWALTSTHPQPSPVVVETAPVAVVASPVVETPAERVTPAVPTETLPAAAPETPAAPATAATSPADVVAQANGQPITRGELDQGVESTLTQYKNIYAQMGQDFSTLLAGAQGFALELGVQAQALERLVFSAIAAAEIKDRGLTVSDDELNTEFQTQYANFLQSQGMTEEKLTTLLAAQNMTLEAFKQSGQDSIKNQLLMMRLQAAVAGPVEQTPEEIQAYWEENKANYETQEEIRASHILVKTEDEAKAILAELEAGADFGKLAREKSTDTASAQKDGDLGWFASGAMVAEFENAAFALEVGQRSGIVPTQYGYHIILLTDKKAATQPAFADVEAKVTEDAKQAVIAERANTWYSEVMAAADVVVNDPLLNAARLQRVNVDLGLAAFEELWKSGTVDDPYLPYVIGTLYENRIQTLTRTKTQLEAAETPDAAKIADVTAQIADAKAKAVAAYQSTIAKAGADADIQARIDALQGTTSTPTTTPAP